MLRARCRPRPSARPAAAALALLLGPGLASAAGFQAHTSREPLAAIEVERPLVLGKGWLEFGLGTDVKIARTSWDSEGEVRELPNTRWMYSTQRVDLRYGITRRGELYGTFKTHYVHLTNDALNTDIRQFGLGDPRFGYKYEVYRGLAPLTSAIVYAEYKAPAANEAPGNNVGGASTFSSVVLTTGTPDVELGARAKRQVGPLALTVGGAYVRRLSNVVQYVVETDFYQFNGRIKPGDIVKVDGELLVQVGPVALQGGTLVQVREATRIGASSEGLFPARDLAVQEGSDGAQWDTWAGVTANITRGVDLVGRVTLPMAGEDLMYFPIEDLHPTRGTTWSGTFEFRY